MKVLVTEPHLLSDEVAALLARVGDVTEGPFSTEELLAVVSDCEVLMVRLGHYIGHKVLDAAPMLRYVVSATTGLDHIDRTVVKARGVRVVSLRDCPDMIQDISATAEHTWGLILALARKIPGAAAHVQSGGWNRNLFWGTQLRGKRLGVIGYGRIGGMVGRFGDVLGMKVVAYDIEPSKILPPADPVPLENLLRTSDVISLHVTADPQNENMINRDRIVQIKPGAYFVNTSRGMLVDDVALADAIRSGSLRGVAVDVLTGEERGESEENPLLALARAGENVLITPHIGGATAEAIACAEEAVVSRLLDILELDEGQG